MAKQQYFYFKTGMPPVKKGKLGHIVSISSDILFYSESIGYKFGNLCQYYKQHDNHLLPPECDENGFVYVTTMNQFIPVSDVVAYSDVPKKAPEIE